MIGTVTPLPIRHGQQEPPRDTRVPHLDEPISLGEARVLNEVQDLKRQLVPQPLKTTEPLSTPALRTGPAPSLAPHARHFPHPPRPPPGPHFLL